MKSATLTVSVSLSLLVATSPLLGVVMAAVVLSRPSTWGLPEIVSVALMPGARLPTVQVRADVPWLVVPWLGVLTRPRKLVVVMPVSVSTMPATVLKQLLLLTATV